MLSDSGQYNFHLTSARQYCYWYPVAILLLNFLFVFFLLTLYYYDCCLSHSFRRREGQPPHCVSRRRKNSRPIALAVGAGGGCLDIFTLLYPFSPLSPSLWETARYRLKYRLKGPLNPKQSINHRLYAICCVHPLPKVGLAFCDFISVTEYTPCSFVILGA